MKSRSKWTDGDGEDDTRIVPPGSSFLQSPVPCLFDLLESMQGPKSYPSKLRLISEDSKRDGTSTRLVSADMPAWNLPETLQRRLTGGTAQGDNLAEGTEGPGDPTPEAASAFFGLCASAIRFLIDPLM